MLFHLTDLASPGDSLLLSPYIAWVTKVFITLLTESDKGSSFPTSIINLEGVIPYWSYHKLDSYHEHKTHCWNHTQSSCRIKLWFPSDLVDKVYCTRSIGLSFLMQVGPVSSWILQQHGHNNLYLWRQFLPSYLCQLNGYCNTSKTWLYQLWTDYNLSLIFPRC